MNRIYRKTAWRIKKAGGGELFCNGEPKYLCCCSHRYFSYDGYNMLINPSREMRSRTFDMEMIKGG
jgi:hypothetical protein